MCVDFKHPLLLADNDEHSHASPLKKRIAPPKLELDFFKHEENEFEAPPGQAKGLEDHALESFDDKLHQISPGSFSSSDPELLECMDDATTPEDLTTPDPYHDSLLEGEEWEWESEFGCCNYCSSTKCYNNVPAHTSDNLLQHNCIWYGAEI